MTRKIVLPPKGMNYDTEHAVIRKSEKYSREDMHKIRQ
jgi:hypothetical protein